MKLAVVLSIAMFMAAASSVSASINVTVTNNATTLANTILGPGITVVGSPTYIGAAGASGTFTNGLSAGIGMESGIILTSGSAASAVGPNTSDSTTTENGLPGDSDLDALAGDSSADATVLQFDFTTTGGDLFFNFVFASEEYNEFVDSGFNDVFGFFVDSTNVALIPGTNTPVSIDNVNGGNPLGNNPSHPEFYNDNDPDDGGPYFDIEYDGFTEIFTAQVLGLGAGTHTIKLAIGDVGDEAYDSAVFIEAGTFADQAPGAVPEPASFIIWTIVGLVGVAMVKLKRRAC